MSGRTGLGPVLRVRRKLVREAAHIDQRQNTVPADERGGAPRERGRWPLPNVPPRRNTTKGSVGSSIGQKGILSFLERGSTVPSLHAVLCGDDFYRTTNQGEERRGSDTHACERDESDDRFGKNLEAATIHLAVSLILLTLYPLWTFLLCSTIISLLFFC